MFLTGEFAKIARVSKRQLQYYDAIGLFSPGHTDPQTGYRYYSAQQLPRLNRILALKDLGFTLEQITEFLKEGITDHEIQVILGQQKETLERSILEDLQRLRRIEARLSVPAHDVPDVLLKPLDAQKILSIEHFCLHAEDGIAFMLFLIERLPHVIHQRSLNRLLALSNSDDFSGENADLEFGFYVDDDTPDEITLADGIVLKTRCLPATQVATLVHVGGPRTAHLTYGVLGRWIESHHYKMSAPPRENFLDLRSPLKEENLVVEIQIPVSPDDSPNWISTQP